MNHLQFSCMVAAAISFVALGNAKAIHKGFQFLALADPMVWFLLHQLPMSGAVAIPVQAARIHGAIWELLKAQGIPCPCTVDSGGCQPQGVVARVVGVVGTSFLHQNVQVHSLELTLVFHNVQQQGHSLCIRLIPAGQRSKLPHVLRQFLHVIVASTHSQVDCHRLYQMLQIRSIGQIQVVKPKLDFLFKLM